MITTVRRRVLAKTSIRTSRSTLWPETIILAANCLTKSTKKCSTNENPTNTIINKIAATMPFRRLSGTMLASIRWIEAFRRRQCRAVQTRAECHQPFFWIISRMLWKWSGEKVRKIAWLKAPFLAIAAKTKTSNYPLNSLPRKITNLNRCFPSKKLALCSLNSLYESKTISHLTQIGKDQDLHLCN